MKPLPHVLITDGACREADPEVFFPKSATSTSGSNFCFACPVRSKCLAWALDNNVEHGVWGGLSEHERRRLRRSRRKPGSSATELART